MIRVMTINDYEQMIELWKRIEGMGLRHLDDSFEGIERYLKRNTSTSFVFEEEDIVGTILAGHDGRRGFIYHLAVDERHRNKGIGRELVNAAITGLKEESIYKVALVVFDKNVIGNDFWENLGFERRDDLTYRNISLSDENY